jgi:hypothetical protein
MVGLAWHPQHSRMRYRSDQAPPRQGLCPPPTLFHMAQCKNETKKWGSKGRNGGPETKIGLVTMAPTSILLHPTGTACRVGHPIEKEINTLGRSSDKYTAPRFSTFSLNSTAPMKIQPSVVNRKGISLAPWWGQSCLHWSVPTPRSCRRPRLEDHNHESKSERRERGRRQMMKKRQDVRLGKRNGKEKKNQRWNDMGSGVYT